MLISLIRKEKNVFILLKNWLSKPIKIFNGNIAELMIATEMELSGRSRDEIIHIMTKNLQVMKKFCY